MSLLSDIEWKLKYTPDDGDLVSLLYVPALECAVRYDRLTGYFQARALMLAARGIEGLVRNNGRMRLLVGCTLNQPEVEAISRGAECRDQVRAHLLANPLRPGNQYEVQALELLAWMVANQTLEVQVAVPCDEHRRPTPADGIFHEKAGIIEDKTGDRLAFNGSLNETENGWRHNWESLTIFRSWLGEDPRVAIEDANFAKLWAGESRHVIAMPVPDAVRDDLLRFLPQNDLPARLKNQMPEQDPVVSLPIEVPVAAPVPEPKMELRRLVWAYIRQAPKMPDGGERVGEATSNVEPWPHQVLAFQRLYGNWPPRLLIADEVGLGKTIQAGMLIRQAWLAEKAKRILIMAPAGICRQWQVELREKFNLNWPVYDGDQFLWLPTPGQTSPMQQPVARSDWHRQPCVIVSSHLMRRRDRSSELIEQAAPWDIVVVDEAHHARRHAPGLAGECRPNRMLALLQRIKARTQSLLLLTATPMQVHPVEVWDLLDLLGLPQEWNESNFLRFCEVAEKPASSPEEIEFLAALFRAAEQHFGVASEPDVRRAGATSGLQAKRILSALRDPSCIPRRQMDAGARAIALRLIRSRSPIGRLISRHTRDLLRRYHAAGKLATPIAIREVEDRFVPLSTAEARIYEAVENYIGTTYNQASANEKNAVGFVMTIYRRRLASSFHALRHTLEGHLEAMTTGKAPRNRTTDEDEDEGVGSTNADGDIWSTDERAALELQALAQEEKSDIAGLLDSIRSLPADSKTRRLQDELGTLRADGYKQVMVFTQYTDTMDFLRDQLAAPSAAGVMCYSGRGGEVRGADGNWRTISREEAKRLFRTGKADILLCTDAAAEGLNFQFCGTIVNYDMPWNPMRVEQRIGRIDRLGQQHAKIRIVNLHYEGTVETDVYMALRRRINLFQSVVGRLQPILSKMPSIIAAQLLKRHGTDPDARAQLVGELERDAETAKHEGLDLDSIIDADLEEPKRPRARLTLQDLDQVLNCPEALPPGLVLRKLQNGEYACQAPGQAQPIRITTRPDYFDDHSDSMELWSPGNPIFPVTDDETLDGDVVAADLPSLLDQYARGRLAASLPSKP